MHSQSAFLWKAIGSGHKQNDKRELCLLCFILLCILLLRNRPHWLSCSYSQQDFGFKAKLGTQMKYEFLPVRHPCGCAAFICHPHSKTKESTAAPTASHMFTSIKCVDNKGTSVMCLSRHLFDFVFLYSGGYFSWEPNEMQMMKLFTFFPAIIYTFLRICKGTRDDDTSGNFE